MARNDVFLNINALSPADAVVTGQQDMTAATVPELVLGDTPTFNFYFTDNTNVWPSWAGNASYTLTWALSDAVAGDFAPAATTGNATPITGGWSVILPLNSYDLVGLLNTKRVGQPYPVQNLWQQLRVTDPSGNEVTRAMFWTPVRYRAISDTQNTQSASPTGGRFVTVNNVNTLTTPTAAQFYAANPVPTSALGSAANGELLIGNGTGFTKATLTAGSGVSITNGSGSITISATDGDITLDDGTAAAPSLKFTADTDTGLFRPSDNVVGISAGGVSRATFGATSAINGTTIPGSKTLVVTTDKLSALAATTSAELAGVISDETGSGALVFANTPTLVTPNIGAATGTSFNLTGSGTLGTTLTVNGTTDSSSKDTGAIVTEGGLGVEKSATIGGNLTVSGTIYPSGASATLTASVANTIIGSNGATRLQIDHGNGGWGRLQIIPQQTRADISAVLNNATTAQTLGLVGSSVEILTSGGTLAATFNSSQNTTLAGNLTVSGTGTSTFAGNLTATGTIRFDGQLLCGNAGGIQIRSAAGDANLVDVSGGRNLTMSGAATFGGNLTVSGGTITGGTSGMSLASGGTNQNITLTPSGTGSVAASSTAANVLTLLRDTTDNGVGTAIKLRQKDSANATVDIADVYAYKSVRTAGSVSSWFAIATRNAGTLTEAMYIAPSGNVVLGSTATDSSNGRLQLATHTTSAGGIGFGTATSIWTAGSGSLRFGDSTNTAQIAISGSGVYIGASAGASGNTILTSGSGATALTLDSSQNAKFSGAVAIGDRAAPAGVSLRVQQAGSDDVGLEWQRTSATNGILLSYNRASSAYTSMSYGASSHTFTISGTTALTLDSSQNATFAGSIAIGNTVNTVSPTSPNRTITMVIGGTTYYIHAKTTND